MFKGLFDRHPEKEHSLQSTHPEFGEFAESDEVDPGKEAQEIARLNNQLLRRNLSGEERRFIEDRLAILNARRKQRLLRGGK